MLWRQEEAWRNAWRAAWPHAPPPADMGPMPPPLPFGSPPLISRLTPPPSMMMPMMMPPLSPASQLYSPHYAHYMPPPPPATAAATEQPPPPPHQQPPPEPPRPQPPPLPTITAPPPDAIAVPPSPPAPPPLTLVPSVVASQSSPTAALASLHLSPPTTAEEKLQQLIDVAEEAATRYTAVRASASQALARSGWSQTYPGGWNPPTEAQKAATNASRPSPPASKSPLGDPRGYAAVDVSDHAATIARRMDEEGVLISELRKAKYQGYVEKGNYEKL